MPNFVQEIFLMPKLYIIILISILYSLPNEYLPLFWMSAVLSMSYD